MSAETDVFSQRIREIRQRILRQAPGRLQEILAQLQSADCRAVSAEERERIYILIHNFAGTAGSVGLEDVGRAAKHSTDHRPMAAGAGEMPAWGKAFEALAQAIVSEQRRET